MEPLNPTREKLKQYERNKDDYKIFTYGVALLSFIITLVLVYRMGNQPKGTDLTSTYVQIGILIGITVLSVIINGILEARPPKYSRIEIYEFFEERNERVIQVSKPLHQRWYLKEKEVWLLPSTTYLVTTSSHHAYYVQILQNTITFCHSRQEVDKMDKTIEAALNKTAWDLKQEEKRETTIIFSVIGVLVLLTVAITMEKTSAPLFSADWWMVVGTSLGLGFMGIGMLILFPYMMFQTDKAPLPLCVHECFEEKGEKIQSFDVLGRSRFTGKSTVFEPNGDVKVMTDKGKYFLTLSQHPQGDYQNQKVKSIMEIDVEKIS